ncbi:MAG: glycoside hydrolase family 25 domain-containing protein [Acidiferrobacteraceae bacterium]
MTLIARAIPAGSAGVDLDSAVTPAIAAGFRAAGKLFCMRYGTTVTAAEIAALHAEGLGVGFVSFGRQADFSARAGAADAAAILTHLRSQGVAYTGATVGLDLETPRGATIADLLAYERGFAGVVVNNGCTSGVYLGAGLGMTSAELYSMSATRYWKSGSRIVDLTGAAAEPACGYCLTQVLPFDQPCGGAEVDYDFAGADFEGREWIALWAA